MDRRFSSALLIFLITACATGREPATSKTKETVGLLTPAGAGSLATAKARIDFRLSRRNSSADLEVVDQRKKLFFVFEGRELGGGSYEVWALDGCGPGFNSVLKSRTHDSRLVDFQTLHGFVITESSSDFYDLADESPKSLYKKKIGFFRKEKMNFRKLDCGVLVAGAGKGALVGIR